MRRAVVMFSGGQDSTTCLIQALQQYDDVHCITFDYRQKHRTEIDVACQLAFDLGIKTHKVIDVSFFNEFAISSLTNGDMPVPVWSESIKNAVPSTFVPGRNILFFTLAAVYSCQVDAQAVIAGVCETDFSGYPDCRDQFVRALNHAVILGTARNIRFETPLMWLNKAETWAMADYYHQFENVCQHTLSCYNNIKGIGCGECAACHLRSQGLQQYQANKENIMTSFKEKMGLL